jgi:hypothetical protein
LYQLFKLCRKLGTKNENKKEKEKTNRGARPACWTARALAHGLARAAAQQFLAYFPSLDVPSSHFLWIQYLFYLLNLLLTPILQ